MILIARNTTDKTVSIKTMGSFHLLDDRISPPQLTSVAKYAGKGHRMVRSNMKRDKFLVAVHGESSVYQFTKLGLEHCAALFAATFPA